MNAAFHGKRTRIALTRCSLAGALCTAIAAWSPSAPAQPTPAKESIPELASVSFAWRATRAEWSDPPAGMRGPIKNDPEHPYHGNLDGPGDRKSTRLNSSH